MKKILGLDIGTNSIGWSLIKNDFPKQNGFIEGVGSRIIPMSQDILDKFAQGQSHSQTSQRTTYRGIRRLYQRNNLRRERLHRVLNIIGFLPKHYANEIDFVKHLGQFKTDKEPKINYEKDETGNYKFIFMNSFNEMINEFREKQPQLFQTKKDGSKTKIPMDWTIYYLRKKALDQKITKEELAWIILNFNTKRGYYQLRGEDIDNSEDKKKEFVILKVRELKDSGETIKKTGEKLFDVYFDNGWKYDKQIVKTENWIGKTKEFIVTTTIKKDGEIKRTFKTVNSEEDWVAIKAKTEQDIKYSGKTVGKYIYETLLKYPKQKIRGKLIKTIERKFYREELEQILKTQFSFHSELKDRNIYQKCIEELYPRNEAHKNNINDKDFIYLFIDDIIFYQRPLKSKKSTIANCNYETKVYIKDGEKIAVPLKGISKSHPLFQEFRLWQFLKNLKIHNEYEEDVTSEILKTKNDWVELFDYLSTIKEIEQKHIFNFLVKKSLLDKNARNYRWNYVEDKKYPSCETRAGFITRLKKIKGINNPIEFLETKTRTNNKETSPMVTREVQLWHIIYSVKDKVQFEQALKTFAKKHSIDVDSFFEAFKKYPPFKNAYGAFSEKALKKILPLMRIGKYWDGNIIPQEVKTRIKKIKEPLDSINYDKEVLETDKNHKLETIVDDAIPKKLLKSFVKFKDKNHLEGLNTYQACYAVYERHSEASEIQKWKSSEDIDKYLQNFKQHSLRNPIVEQVVTETLRTVRDIWQFYGKGEKDFFDEIHIELGRDMKNPADKRKRISARNRENENTNQRIKALLQELMSDGAKPFSPSHQEILKIYEEGVYQNPDANYNQISENDIINIRKKSAPTKSDIQRYKLWLEQGYRSPYTGKIIPLGKLFTTEYQIEHIIPQARYFDNSLSNKVICESAVNQLKGNKTAYEFIKNPEIEIVDLGQKKNVKLFNLQQYESHCKHYFAKNRIKLKKLLSEDIPESFIERQINDTRYISKFLKGLLSNIVREEGEKEITSKNVVPVTGAITSKLKEDWGLNAKWNEIITPRFKRLNELTNSKDFGDWDYQTDENGNKTGKQFFRIQVPDDISKGFSKKRIDHRHHALDALVIACVTRNHIQYLNSLNNKKIKFALQPSLLVKNNRGNFTKQFKKPWSNFTEDAKDNLEKIVVTFKQNIRVINKSNNKTWQWIDINGKLEKRLVRQTKGKNWAIRKPLHTPLPYGRIKYNFSVLEISKNIGKRDLIYDDLIRNKVKKAFNENNNKIGDTERSLKRYPIKDESGRDIKFCVFSIPETKYRKRQPISKLSNRGKGGIKTTEQAISFINKVSDKIIRNDLLCHLKKNGYDIDKAFSIEGLETFNSKRKIPVYNLPISESSTNKFPLGMNRNTKVKYGEAESGTNLFFAFYWSEKKQKREYETIPLNEVIEHQKWRASLPKEKMKTEPIIPINSSKGRFLFVLSPNDLVYLPTDEEIEYPHNVDFNNLLKEQVERIYKMVSSSGNQCFFIKNSIAKPIINKKEFSTLNKMEKSIDNIMIKEICWKLNVDRLGNVKKVTEY